MRRSLQTLRLWNQSARRMLGVGLIAGLLLTTLVPASAAQAQPDIDARLVALVNEWRTDQGLNPLSEHPGLSARALEWAEHMRAGDEGCGERGSNYGHSDVPRVRRDTDPPGTTAAYENIQWLCASRGLQGVEWSTNAGPLPAYCVEQMDLTTPETMMCRWLASPGHRANLSRPELTHVASGTASINLGFVDQRWSTHMFTVSDAPAELRLDPNCDGILDIRDAFAIAQFVVGLRADGGACPLDNHLTEINRAKADFNGDGTVNIADAAAAARCVVGLDECD